MPLVPPLRHNGRSQQCCNCVCYSKDGPRRNRAPARGADWSDPSDGGIGLVPCDGEVPSGCGNQAEIGRRGGKGGGSGGLVADAGEAPSRRRVWFDGRFRLLSRCALMCTKTPRHTFYGPVSFGSVSGGEGTICRTVGDDSQAACRVRFALPSVRLERGVIGVVVSDGPDDTCVPIGRTSWNQETGYSLAGAEYG